MLKPLKYICYVLFVATAGIMLLGIYLDTPFNGGLVGAPLAFLFCVRLIGKEIKNREAQAEERPLASVN